MNNYSGYNNMNRPVRHSINGKVIIIIVILMAAVGFGIYHHHKEAVHTAYVNRMVDGVKVSQATPRDTVKRLYNISARSYDHNAHPQVPISYTNRILNSGFSSDSTDQEIEDGYYGYLLETKSDAMGSGFYPVSGANYHTVAKRLWHYIYKSIKAKKINQLPSVRIDFGYQDAKQPQVIHIMYVGTTHSGHLKSMHDKPMDTIPNE